MDDWSASDSDDEQQPPPAKPQQAASKKTADDDWDASSASDDDAPSKEPKTESQPPKPSKPAEWDDSEESDNDLNGANEPTKEPTKEAKPESEEPEYDEEALKKMKKKMQNFKKKAKKKNKRKKKKKKPPPQKSIPKNQDELIEMSSSDSSDDDNNKTTKKMETYEERMRTDNDILFEGHKANNKAKQPEKDERPMLSGEVTIRNFPLGSTRDCENFAGQISGLLDGALFRQEIDTSDVFEFYKKLLSSPILEKLDMVEAKELTTKMNQLLAAKQKAWHVKKNPKNKKKKKPQWIVSDTFNRNQSNKHGHVDGQYDQDEYSLFD
eukprot:156814_1